MRYRHYIFIGIFAYLIFLITTIPAAPVIGLLKDSIPVNISNVSGTLWKGRAGTVDTRRNIILHNIEWSFLPFRLLILDLAVNVDAEYNNNPLNTRLSAGIGGNLSVDNLNMKLDASDVASLIALPVGELSGEFQLHVDNASFEPGAVPRIEGTLNWNQAAVTVAETAELGNVSIMINESDESPLIARISNKGGHLSLNGDFTTTENGDYSLKLKMKPNATASSNLVSSLDMVSKKQANGEYLLNNKGNLKQLGFM